MSKVVLLLIVISSCRLPRSSLAGTHWRLASIERGRQIEQVIGGKDITAEFTDGMIRGVSGCNMYGSEFTVTGNRLAIKDVGGTQMGCTIQQDVDYWRALDASTSFTLTGDTLTISNVGGTLHLTRM